ncbi:DUF5691 domain-containing protein [Aureispira anguillae]|uniref:DUF5691 domain-containing protein n=1 Tax=Aureispira anguillae TaxID=2864201 RepID=A0A915YE22_9BACT|nr:DUF5691 domain-containing protein [Aureispira anguillae]BDS11313.1 DUF5691 domain-containing protein [Aureispira anguillae]
MSTWQELVRQALIGNVSNKKIIPILLRQLEQYGLTLPQNQAPEKTLLKAAAIQNKLYTSAQILTVHSSKVPNAIAPEEELDYCNPQRKFQFQYILKHKYDDILLELLELLANRQLIVMPELLPELLDYGIQRNDLQPFICACIGQRGHWLAQQAQQWNYALKQAPTEAIFFYGNQEERVQYLIQIHQSNPEQAIELLQQVWDQEGFMTKANFIRALGQHLAPSDAPFLEFALQDKRQEVRSQAAKLLALLPNSKLVQRMQDLAQQLISYHPKKNILEVELPASCTNRMKIDGILPRQVFIKDHGPKANQLAQIIAKIPPQWWENLFYKNPQQLLLLSAKTEWKNVLVWGWAKAAKNFGATEWIIACHRFYLDTFFKHNWSNLSIDFLYQDLPNDLFNALANEYLKTDNRPTLSDDHPIVSFLLAEGQKWNESISKKVIQRIKNTIKQDTYVFHWSLKTVLKRAAFSISPNLYDTIKEGWPTQCHAWHSWQKEVDHMLSILKFRQEISQLED